MTLPKAAFVLVLSLLPALGCHRAQPRREVIKLEEGLLPLHILMQIQVIGLRETAIAATEPFPAPGFRFAEDRVAPVEEPDTVAGVELTREQLARWLAALPKSGALTVHVQQAFLVQPNSRASRSNFQESRYCSNWRIDAEAAAPQFASLTPGFAADLVPRIVPGSPDLLVSADLRVLACELEPFNASEGFAPPETPKSGRSPDKPVLDRDRKPAPLVVQLPRQTILRLATSVPIRPGRAVILAHYVKQYMAPVPIPARPAGTRPPAAAADQPVRMQAVREHVFCIVAAQRSKEEPKSDIPIVAEVFPRYALSATWNQWEPSRSEPPSPPSAATGDAAETGPGGVPAAQPPTANGDLAEILKAAEGMRKSPQAVSQSFSVAATVKKPIHVEVGEDRSYVAGIHRDSDEATSPRTFDIGQTTAGMRLETLLEPAAGGVSAALNGRFAAPPRWDGRTVLVPSARRKPEKAPDKDAKPPPTAVAVAGGTEEYHFQVPSQYVAEFKSSLEFISGEIRILPLTWRATGIAAPDKESRLATLAVKLLPDADQKKDSAPAAAPAP